MPTKRGNGGHGEENYDATTGRYVKGNGGSGLSKSESGNTFFNLNDITSFMQKKKDEASSSQQPISVTTDKRSEIYGIIDSSNNIHEMAKAVGTALGYNEDVISFSKNTTRKKAAHMCKAICDVTLDFPDLKDVLMSFTNRYRTKDNRQSFFERTSVFIKSIMDPNSNSMIAKVAKKNGLYDILSKGNSFIERMRYHMSIMLQDSSNSDIGKNNFGVEKSIMYTNPSFFNLGEEENKALGMALSVQVSKKITSSDEIMKYEKDYVPNEKDILYKYKNDKLRFHFLAEHGLTYQTSTHELGHAVDALMRYSDIPEYNDFLSKIKLGKSKKIDETLDYGILGPFISDKYKKKFYTRPAYDDTSSTAEAFRKGEISRYALYNRKELIAEAFSDYYDSGDKCTPYNRYIVDKIKEIYKKAHSK